VRAVSRSVILTVVVSGELAGTTSVKIVAIAAADVGATDVGRMVA